MSATRAGSGELPRLSIVVPTLNEAMAIERLQDQLDGIDLDAENAEVVFADGGSTDGTAGRVRPRYRLVAVGEPGRGPALNAGARAATGELLLFLHCDSVLPDGALAEVRRVLGRFSAGSFGIRFDRKSPVLLLCQTLSNLRIRFRHLAYGDQGLFIGRELFFQMGGFPNVPLMEDYQLAMNLRAAGVRMGLARRRLVTSSRRFAGGELQKLRTWAGMARLRRRYRSGASPAELARRYGEVREAGRGRSEVPESGRKGAR